MCEEQLVFELACRPHCDQDKSTKIRVCVPAASFGEVRANRKGRSAHLTGQSKAFLCGKARRPTVNFQRQVMGFAPHPELSEIHRHSAILTTDN